MDKLLFGISKVHEDNDRTTFMLSICNIGCVMVDIYSNRKYGYISNLCVSKNYRNKGYGTFFIKECEKLIKNNMKNYAKLDVCLSSENSGYIVDWLKKQGYNEITIHHKNNWLNMEKEIK